MRKSAGDCVLRMDVEIISNSGLGKLYVVESSGIQGDCLCVKVAENCELCRGLLSLAFVH